MPQHGNRCTTSLGSSATSLANFVVDTGFCPLEQAGTEAFNSHLQRAVSHSESPGNESGAPQAAEARHRNDRKPVDDHTETAPVDDAAPAQPPPQPTGDDITNNTASEQAPPEPEQADGKVAVEKSTESVSDSAVPGETMANDLAQQAKFAKQLAVDPTSIEQSPDQVADTSSQDGTTQPAAEASSGENGNSRLAAGVEPQDTPVTAEQADTALPVDELQTEGEAALDNGRDPHRTQKSDLPQATSDEASEATSESLSTTANPPVVEAADSQTAGHDAPAAEVAAETATAALPARGEQEPAAEEDSEDSRQANPVVDAPPGQAAPRPGGDMALAGMPDTAAQPPAEAPKSKDLSDPKIQAPQPSGSVVVDARGEVSTARVTLNSQGTANPAGEAPPEQATAPAERTQFVQRVSRAFQAMGDRQGPLRLKLNPPELGSLRLEIQVRGGVLTARAEAETSTARNLLLDNLPALRERLAQQDIKVQQFEVDLGNHSSGGMPGQTSHQSPFEGRQSDGQPPSAPAPQPAATEDAATETQTPTLLGEGGRLNLLI